MFFLTFVMYPAHAQDNIVFNLSVGNVGSMGNFSSENYPNATFSLFNIGIEDKKTNLGAEFNPFTIFYWSDKNDKTNAKSFFNLQPYWNVINNNFYDKIIFYLGPFISVNYLSTDNKIMINHFIYSSGLQMGFRVNSKRFNYNIFSIESGYRTINGNSRFYAGAKIDLIILLSIFLITFDN